MKKYNWLKVLRPKMNPRLRLFCFPYAGGSSAIYSEWLKLLDADIELIAIQLPGRAERIHETPIGEMDKLTNGILAELQNLQDIPFAFFGHSMGARIAYALSLKMQTLGNRLPDRLILSAHGAPEANKKPKTLHTLPDDELISELRLMNGTSKELLENKELMSFILPMIRADFKVACERIDSDVKLPCTASVVSGIEDFELKYHELEAWADCFRSTLDIHLIAGDHFFINKNTGTLLSLVNTILAPENKRSVLEFL
jgi:surfactin synthase thioesterase subunit